jgi:hypothetical protein
VSVDYATADGSATAGADYTAIPATTLNFGDTQTSATFDVAILDDGTWEGDEDFSVALSNATGGATLGTPSSAVVTITEDDPGPGAFQFSAATYSVAENGLTLTVTVNRVGGSAGAVSVDYATADGSATAGLDYTAAAGTLSFGDGDAVSQTFDISITDDVTYEGDEDFNLALSNPTGGATLTDPSSAVATIVEDDPAPNVAPVANDDYPPDVTRGSLNVVIDLTGNDTDVDGTIVDASVIITTGALNQRGGTVVNNFDGTATYSTPNAGFRGTDTFQYTVNDNDGATSNVATVHINVVK